MAVHISPIGPVITQQQTHIYLLRNIYYRCCQLCVAIERGGVNASSNCVYIQPRIKKKKDHLAFHVQKKKREKNTCVQQLYTLPGEKRVKWFQYFFFLGGEGWTNKKKVKKKKIRPKKLKKPFVLDTWQSMERLSSSTQGLAGFRYEWSQLYRVSLSYAFTGIEAPKSGQHKKRRRKVFHPPPLFFHSCFIMDFICTRAAWFPLFFTFEFFFYLKRIEPKKKCPLHSPLYSHQKAFLHLECQSIKIQVFALHQLGVYRLGLVMKDALPRRRTVHAYVKTITMLHCVTSWRT